MVLFLLSNYHFIIKTVKNKIVFLNLHIIYIHITNHIIQFLTDAILLLFLNKINLNNITFQIL